MNSPETAKEFHNECFENLKNLKNQIDKKIEKSNAMMSLENYIYDLIVYLIYEITTNKYPPGKKYNKIYIKITYMKDHLEEVNCFTMEETTVKKMKKDLKKYIKLNSVDKWKAILNTLEYVLPEEEIKKFKNIDFDKKKFNELCLDSKKHEDELYEKIKKVINLIDTFFINYIKERV